MQPPSPTASHHLVIPTIITPSSQPAHHLPPMPHSNRGSAVVHPPSPRLLPSTTPPKPSSRSPPFSEYWMSPRIVSARRLTRYKEVILLNDLIDCAHRGEEIEVIGIYTNNFDLSLNTKNGFPVFTTVIEENYVTKKQDLFSAYKLTQDDKEDIKKLFKDPQDWREANNWLPGVRLVSKTRAPWVHRPSLLINVMRVPYVTFTD
ncbi:DNA replication licensing factor MCM2 [Tanacetum coccineum]